MVRSSEPSPEPQPMMGHQHAVEQKSLLEALSNQVELLQQRDVHHNTELERLRRLVGEAAATTQAPHGSTYQSPPKGSIRSDHIDEIEALRREKRDLQLHNCELEVQIQDAAQSIEGFSSAIEKLEEGYKTKEETWKRQIADLQRESDGLARTNRQLQSQCTKAECDVAAKDRALADMRVQFDAFKVQAVEQTQDRRVLESTQDTLRATQMALEQAEELNRKLSTQLASLQTKHADALQELGTKARQVGQMETANRPQGQSVLVKTLRDEVRLLKGKLEEQFRDEKAQLVQRVQALEGQVVSTQAALRQKDDAIRNLQRDVDARDAAATRADDTKRALDAKVERMERELATAHADLRQLEACRGFLGDNIELGFKELLQLDHETDALERKLAAATASIETLTLERDTLRHDATRAADAADHLRRQVDDATRELKAAQAAYSQSRAEAARLPALEAQVHDWSQ
ncbi:hypothetical protein As57867_011812, partial [Aphanomyces stellatus]